MLLLELILLTVGVVVMIGIGAETARLGRLTSSHGDMDGQQSGEF